MNTSNDFYSFWRSAKKCPLRLLFIATLILLMGACDKSSVTSPTEAAPTQGAIATSTVEIGQAEAPSLYSVSTTSTAPTETVTGSRALEYLNSVDPLRGWFNQDQSKVTFLDANGVAFTANLSDISFAPASDMFTVFDEHGKPVYVRSDHTWVKVTEDNPTTHFIRERGLNGRDSNWNSATHKWELSMPITDIELQQLGAEYSIDEIGNLVHEGLNVYSGKVKKSTVISLTASRDLKIMTAEGGEMTLAPENLVKNTVPGLDYNGSPINIILTMKADGWGPLGQFMYTPSWGDTWTTRPEISSGLGKQSLEELPESTWDDEFSQRSFYAELLSLQPDKQTSRETKLQIVRSPLTADNVWTLTENVVDSLNVEEMAEVDPLTKSNDRVQLVSVRRLTDPNGKVKIIFGYQYPIGDRFVVEHSMLGEGILGNQFNFVKQTLSGERWIEPILSTWPGADCTADGGLGGTIEQGDLCALFTEKGWPAWPRELMPANIQEQMRIFDDLSKQHNTAPRFDVTANMQPLLATMQHDLFPSYYFNSQHYPLYLNR